jgi:hypothetical protein
MLAQVPDMCAGHNFVMVVGGRNLDILAFLLGEFKCLKATTHRLFEL